MHKMIFAVLLTVAFPLLPRADRDTPLTNPPVVAIAQDQLNQQLTDAILAVSVDEVKKAIAAGGDVNYVDHDGKTPAWLALLLGKFDILVVLLESGAKSNIAYRGNTFVQAVFEKANMHWFDPLAIKCLSLLLVNNADFSNIRFGGRGDIVEFVLFVFKHRYSRPSQLRTNLLELVQQLKKHDYKIMHAVWDSGEPYFYSDSEIVSYCIKSGININQNVENVISQPLKNYQLPPMPALFIAIRFTFGEEAVTALLDAGADMNLIADPDGKGKQTPLDWALSLGSSDAIRILMQRGAKTYKQLQST